MDKSLKYILELAEKHNLTEANEFGKEDPKTLKDPNLFKLATMLDKAIYPNLMNLQKTVKTTLNNFSLISKFFKGMNLPYNLLSILDKLGETTDQKAKQEFLNDLNNIFLLINKVDASIEQLSAKYQTNYYTSQ